MRILPALSSTIVLTLLVAATACVEPLPEEPTGEGRGASLTLEEGPALAADELEAMQSYTIDEWAQTSGAVDETPGLGPEGSTERPAVSCNDFEGYTICCVGMYCCFFFGGEPICL